jgi:hypothetical protein
MNILGRLADAKYKVKCFFFPMHQTVRRSIPRTWSDSDYLIVHTNFAIIKEFVEEELNGLKDVQKEHSFNANNGNLRWAQFYHWLEKAYIYITQERPRLEEEMDNAYPDLGDNPLDDINDTKVSYQQKYGEVDRLEKLIKDKDTQILKEMIEERGGFWT